MKGKDLAAWLGGMVVLAGAIAFLGWISEGLVAVTVGFFASMVAIKVGRLDPIVERGDAMPSPLLLGVSVGAFLGSCAALLMEAAVLWAH